MRRRAGLSYLPPSTGCRFARVAVAARRGIGGQTAVSAIRTIRVFVASPDDVSPERELVDSVAARLNVRFAETVRFQVVRWEHLHYRAHQTFQPQIPEAADCDIVIGILGDKVGSELPDDF